MLLKLRRIAELLFFIKSSGSSAREQIKTEKIFKLFIVRLGEMIASEVYLLLSLFSFFFKLIRSFRLFLAYQF